MAIETKQQKPSGFRPRRSKTPPPPAETEGSNDPAEGGDGSSGTPSAPPPEASSTSSTGSGRKSSRSSSSKPKTKESGSANDSGEAPSGGGENDSAGAVADTLGSPDEENIMLGISTTNDLWKTYKQLSNQTGVDGKPVKVARIVRGVLSESLPSPDTEEGLARARQYGLDWDRTRSASSSPRSNRQLYLPTSMVRNLRRLSMILEDRGHSTSISAIVSGVLAENVPTVSDIRKLVNS